MVRNRFLTTPTDAHPATDSFLLVMLGLAFAIATALLAAGLWLLTRAPLLPVIVTSAIVAAAGCGAWFFARRWRAQTPAIALVVFLALLAIPRLFVMDGIFLSEAAGMPASRLVTAMGLNVGAVFLVLLAFLIVGFIAPLIGAAQRQARHEAGAKTSMRAHLALTGVAVLAAAFTATPLQADLNFALFRGDREAAVARVTSGQAELSPDKLRPERKRLEAAATFPRLACCGGAALVLEDGRVLFPMSAGGGAWGFLHDDAVTDDPRFRTLHDYGKGWRRVAIAWSAG
jgi:hypothetical protein